jgi:hypothetical protein
MEYRIKIEEAEQSLLNETGFGSINQDIDEEQEPRKLSFQDTQTLMKLKVAESLKVEEVLQVVKKSKVNSLNQPPRREMVFSIVFYIALCYVLNYLIISLVMNIVMLSSSDFRRFTSREYSCPDYIIGFYLYMETLAPLCFVGGYLLL